MRHPQCTCMHTLDTHSSTLKTMCVCTTDTSQIAIHTYLGLARTIYIRCIHGIFGREISKYTVIKSVCIRLWPALHMLQLWARHIHHRLQTTHVWLADTVMHVYVHAYAHLHMDMQVDTHTYTQTRTRAIRPTHSTHTPCGLVHRCHRTAACSCSG
jgi:hypothetical protein